MLDRVSGTGQFEADAAYRNGHRRAARVGDPPGSQLGAAGRRDAVHRETAAGGGCVPLVAALVRQPKGRPVRRWIGRFFVTARPLRNRLLWALITVADVPGGQPDVAISRIARRRAADVQATADSALLHTADTVPAQDAQRNPSRYQRVVGDATDDELLHAPGAVTHRRVIVTNSAVLGKTVRQLGLEHRFGVSVARVSRAGLELTAVPSLNLQFGDVLQVVGHEDRIGEAAALLGNSLKAVNQTHSVPLLVGILAGIALGTWPFAIPGFPQPLRLGLAGGPLLVAISVSRVGRIGPLVWHMPLSVNLAFREFGIAIFLASVGLMAGPQFVAVLFSARGALWLASGICVTVLPLLFVGWLALAVWKMNFVVVLGLITGSMTDSSALAFASGMCGADSPMVAYAAVYPLTTLVRILAIQVLAVVLCG